jgi:Right handed beta helix region
MQSLHFETAAIRSIVVKVTIAVGFFLCPVATVLAANHVLASQTGSFDCGSVKPGDTVTLQSGERGPLKIRNCNATADNPIRIRNDSNGSGPTTIRRSSGSAGGFILSCENCVGVEIDGSYKWRGAPTGKTYGIKVTMTGGDAPSAFVKIRGLSRFVTIRNIEIDGAWPRLADNGIGLSVNDHSVNRSEHPGFWREGILIEHNYIHDVEGEGMYVGPNYRAGEVPLRDVEIRHNLVEDIGWEGINTKSMLAGNNSIHHNVLRRIGKNDSNPDSASQFSAINNNTGTVKIYSNWVEATGAHGIKLGSGDGPLESDEFGPFVVHVWNNVIVDSGSLWRSFMGDSHGINVSSKEGVEKPVAYIYYNTIVNPRNSGISVASNAGAGSVRDNIIAGASDKPISAPEFIRLSNNRTGTVSEMLFIDAGRKNFRLRPESPARNQGSNEYPDTDFDDVSRAPDGVVSQGAFEFTSQTTAATPKAPHNLAVE